MKAIAALVLVSAALGQGYHRVGGYTTKRGAYVAPHYQTRANRTKLDNWSTRGNVNPFTGKGWDRGSF